MSAAERNAFERHLDVCEFCGAEVADLAVLPSLLSQLDPDTAFAVAHDGEDSTYLPGNWPDDEPFSFQADDRPRHAADRAAARWAGQPAASWAGPTAAAGPTASAGLNAPAGNNDKVVSLLGAAKRRRATEKRRRRFIGAATLVAAACLAVVVGLGAPVLFTKTPAQPKLTAMTAAAANVPVKAELGLQPVSSGTKVIMKCSYTAAGSGEKWSYKLVAVPKSGGTAEPLGDWKAGPGDEFEITSMSTLKTEDISRVEVQNAEGKTLLVYQPA
jgi:hypothetical protein